MTYTAALKHSIRAVIGGILLGVYAGSLLFAAVLRMGDGPAWQRWLQVPIDALGVSLYALLATAPSALLLWWPAYAFLLYKGWASWPAVAGVACLPAALALALEGSIIGGLVALYAFCIALVTHALYRRFARAVPAPSEANGA